MEFLERNKNYRSAESAYKNATSVLEMGLQKCENEFQQLLKAHSRPIEARLLNAIVRDPQTGVLPPLPSPEVTASVHTPGLRSDG